MKIMRLFIALPVPRLQREACTTMAPLARLRKRGVERKRAWQVSLSDRLLAMLVSRAQKDY